MAKQVQIRRGSNTEAIAFTGASGELIYNTDKKTVSVHDGVEPGGYTFASNDVLASSAGATMLGYKYNAASTQRTVAEKIQEYVSILDFGADPTGVTSSAAAFVKAFAASNYVHVPKGSFRLTTQIPCPDLRALTGAPGSELILDKSVGGLDKYAFTRQVNGGQIRRATCNTNVTVGSTVITLSPIDITAESDTDTLLNGITAGMLLLLRSDELFHGIPDESTVLGHIPGFGGQPKGEYVEVLTKVGNIITLAEPIRDSYRGSSYPIEVHEAKFAPSLEISGLTVRYDAGIGIGTLGISDNDDAATDPGYDGRDTPWVPGFFAIRLARSVSLYNNRFINMPSICFTTGYCLGVQCYSNDFRGPEISDTRNSPYIITRWAKGLSALSCQGVAFTGNRIENLRRGLDAASFSAGAICRDIVNSYNVCKSCSDMIGGHVFQNYTAVGNTGTANDLAYLRGKDITLIGNYCQVQGSVRAIGIGGGVPDGTSYDGDYSSGIVTIIGNRASGRFEAGIEVRGSITSMTVSDNWIGVCEKYGISFISKNLKNIKIGGTFRGDTITTDAYSQSYVVAVINDFTVPLETLNGFEVSGLTTSGRFRRGIGIPGTMFGTGATGLRIDNCVFEDIVSNAVVLAPIGGDGLGVRGNHAAPCVIGSIISRNQDPAVATIFIPAAPGAGGPWPIASPYQTHNVPHSHELYHYEDDTDLGTVPGGSARTYYQGARRYYNDPTFGAYMGQVCITSGTSGTLVGCTGSISAGSRTITVNASAAGLINTSALISIAGAGTTGAALSARVVAKNRPAAVTTVMASMEEFIEFTLDIAAGTTVNDAVITWQPSIWRGFGTIAAE